MEQIEKLLLQIQKVVHQDTGLEETQLVYSKNESVKFLDEEVCPENVTLTDCSYWSLGSM